MKYIKNINTFIAALIMVLFVSSCSEFEYNETKVNDDSVWSEYTYIRQGIGAVYAQTPATQMHIDGAYLASAIDDSESSNEFSTIHLYNTGSWDMFTNPNSSWEKNYMGIRRANQFIESVDTVSLYNYTTDPLEFEEKMDDVTGYRGEARFLRAYFYFELMKQYGGVPIIEEVYEVDSDVSPARNSYEECLEYVASQCDEAIALMKPYVDVVNNDDDRGKASDGAAYALKSRAYLYAASPLNNPTGSFDKYYDSCIVAANEVFEIGYYSLVGSYTNLFTPDHAKHLSNTEVIFDRRETASSDLEMAALPISFTYAKGYTNPSQNLVDAYEMTDGSTFDWNNPEHAADPYANRDSRFEATIIYNGDIENNRVIETYEGGCDAPGNAQSYYGTKTGYYLKKGLKTNLDLASDATAKHFWFYFRYAEVLLNYAEAMNEVYGPDVDFEGNGKTALQAINEVRSRAKQPNLASGLTKDEFREKLRNERRVEFAFEDHRFWDLRRWDIATEVLNEDLMGVKITLSDDNGFDYTPVVVETRTFEPKMNRFPIAYSELKTSPQLTQTPGW